MAESILNSKKGLLGDIMLIALLLFTVSTFYFIFSWVVERDLIGSDLHLEQNNLYEIPSILLKSEINCLGGITNYVLMDDFCSEEEVYNHLNELFDLFQFETFTYVVFDEDQNNDLTCYNLDPDNKLGLGPNCESLVYSISEDRDFLYRDGKLELDLNADNSEYDIIKHSEVDYHFVFDEKNYYFKITFKND